MSLSPEDMKRIGGSDVAAIVGLSPYGSAYSVWERIMHGTERADTPALSRGRRLEPVVLDWYAEETGRILNRGPDGKGIRWPTSKPHRRASLDAVSWDSGAWGRDEWDRVVDAKTAGASEARRWGEEGTDAIPSEYLCQFQFYMGETGRVRTDVPTLLAGDFRLYVVAFDAEVYGELSEAVDRFWVDHVLTGKPPEVTARPNDVEAIERRFPKHTAAEYLDWSTLDPMAQATIEEYLRAYAEESAAAERLALYEARAKLLVGDAPGVKGLPEALGFHRLDWASHEKGKTAWKQVAEALAQQHGVSPETLKKLAAEHAGEVARPFQPRATTKGKR